jgi:hypothetical protein
MRANGLPHLRCTRRRVRPRYAAGRGGAGDSRTVWIGPHTVPCDTDNSGRCYRVRESEDDPWEQWHGRIQGFNYVEGYDYELVVKAYRSDVKLEDESRDPASHSATCSPTPAARSWSGCSTTW